MEMASWFKTPEGIIFLCDDDVRGWHEDHESEGAINWNDFVGHHGIIKVFGVPDKYPHTEGFAGMPDVIRKCILDGKLDMLCSHATNLREALPEFIPTLQRLAKKKSEVASQLQSNPYLKVASSGTLTVLKQMEVGIKSGFDGSTIGNLLRCDGCGEEVMMLALKDARKYMDAHNDHHHYKDIIAHGNVTKKVLEYIIKDIRHDDVVAAAEKAIKTIGKRVPPPPPPDFSTMKIRVIKKGNAKVRIAT